MKIIWNGVLVSCLLAINICANAQQVKWDGGGDKVHWSDPDNWDNNVIPITGDFVFIEDGEVELDIDTEIAHLSLITTELVLQKDLTVAGDSIGICMNSSLLINGANLVITVDSLGIRLSDESQLSNEDGSILIKESRNAILIEEESLVENKAHLEIGNGDSTGIINFGDLINWETIIVKDMLFSHGIINEHHFENKNGASLSIENIGTGKNGIYSDSLSLILNQGNIDIRETAHIAIRSQGTLDNYGNISMIQCLGGLSTSIFNSETASKLINRNTGRIVQVGGSSAVSFGSQDSVFNYGLISITDTYCNGIFSSAYMENHDSIIVDSAMTCSTVDNRGYLLNKNTGVISGMNSHGLISNDSTLINEGNILGDQLSRGINNRGYFESKVNSQIQIDNTQDWNLLNSGVFTLHGSFTSIHNSDRGIHNFGDFHISTTGSLTMEAIQGDLLDQNINLGGTLLVEGVLDLKP